MSEPNQIHPNLRKLFPSESFSCGQRGEIEEEFQRLSLDDAMSKCQLNSNNSDVPHNWNPALINPELVNFMSQIPPPLPIPFAFNPFMAMLMARNMALAAQGSMGPPMLFPGEIPGPFLTPITTGGVTGSKVEEKKGRDRSSHDSIRSSSTHSDVGSQFGPDRWASLSSSGHESLDFRPSHKRARARMGGSDHARIPDTVPACPPSKIISMQLIDASGGGQLVSRRGTNGRFDVRIVYARSFILQCALSPHAAVRPSGLEQILKENSEMASVPGPRYHPIHKSTNPPPERRILNIEEN